MADKKIYWHLPGFCYFRLLNQVLMNLMKDYPDCFEEKYCIGSVYGTFPGAVWNGGRAVFGITGIKDIRAILKLYNDRGVLSGSHGQTPCWKRSTYMIPTAI